MRGGPTAPHGFFVCAPAGSPISSVSPWGLRGKTNLLSRRARGWESGGGREPIFLLAFAGGFAGSTSNARLLRRLTAFLQRIPPEPGCGLWGVQRPGGGVVWHSDLGFWGWANKLAEGWGLVYSMVLVEAQLKSG